MVNYDFAGSATCLCLLIVEFNYANQIPLASSQHPKLCGKNWSNIALVNGYINVFMDINDNTEWA